MSRHQQIINVIKGLYPDRSDIPLHEPTLGDVDKQHLVDCIDSGFVSSVGKEVEQFEKMTAEYLGVPHAVAIVNGTQALFTALLVKGCDRDSEVITQALSFVATANAIAHTGATPVFVDVSPKTLGMSPESLSNFLNENTSNKSGKCINKHSGKTIKACVPVHTLGHLCDVDEVVKICSQHDIPVIEDAAESLGSRLHDQHAGSFGEMGVLSFNGNKIITTGGGGMIVTKNEKLAKLAKHISSTAKVPDPIDMIHDETGYNNRLPNLNAALGVAQFKKLETLLQSKRKIAQAYQDAFKELGVSSIEEPQDRYSNYWLNAIQLSDLDERNAFIREAHAQKVQVRPLWKPLPELDMYKTCQCAPIEVAKNLYQTIVTLPSSPRIREAT